MLNLTFQHPRTWRVDRRNRREIVFAIPSVDTSARASLTIVRAQYRGTEQAWQELQKTSNELQGRTVVRQWTLDILGAPILQTQVEFTDKTVSYTQVTGLYYTRTPLKMLFTLRVPTSQFETVSLDWQQSLESFRLIQGETMEREDPNAPAATQPVRPTPVNPTRILDSERRVVSDYPRTRNDLQMVVGNRNIRVRGRDSWTVRSATAGQLEYQPRRGAMVLKGTLGDQRAGANAAAILAEAARADLERFRTVAIRQDQEAEDTRFGMKLSSVFRVGESATGALATYTGILYSPENYVIVRFEWTNVRDAERERRQIDELMRSLRIDVVPG